MNRITVRGLDLLFLPQMVEETFWRMARHCEYDVAELSLSTYPIARDQGSPPLTAIPAFPSRMFRHSAISIHTNSGIRQPQDLPGRQVGIPEYRLTALLWVRGILADDYGVHPWEIEWYVGGEEGSGQREKLPLRLPPTLHLHSTSPGTTFNDLLVHGEIDALIAPLAPSAFVQGEPSRTSSPSELSRSRIGSLSPYSHLSHHARCCNS